MKIAMITHSAFPDFIGGREHHIHLLAKGLARQGGDQISVFTGAQRGTKVTRQDMPEGYALVRVPGMRLMLSRNPRQIYHIAPKLIGALRRERVDVVHLFEYGSFMTTAAGVYAIRNRLPFVQTVYGYELPHWWLRVAKRAFDRSVGAYIVRRAAKIICVSAVQREEMLAIGGGSVRDATVVRINGIDTTAGDAADASGPGEGRIPAQGETRFLPRAVNVLIAARLEPRKGVTVLLSAFKQVLDSLPEKNACLYLVGPDRGEQRAIEQRIEQLAVGAHVRLLGAVAPNAMNTLLKKMDIVVVPSLYEGMPLIVLEAMSCGKPVIASRLAGVSKVITSGVNGILVSPGDSGELCDALRQLIMNPARGTTLGNAARQTAAAYDIRREITWLREDVYAPAGERARLAQKVKKTPPMMQDGNPHAIQNTI